MGLTSVYGRDFVRHPELMKHPLHVLQEEPHFEALNSSRRPSILRSPRESPSSHPPYPLRCVALVSSKLFAEVNIQPKLGDDTPEESRQWCKGSRWFVIGKRLHTRYGISKSRRVAGQTASGGRSCKLGDPKASGDVSALSRPPTIATSEPHPAQVYRWTFRHSQLAAYTSDWMYSVSSCGKNTLHHRRVVVFSTSQPKRHTLVVNFDDFARMAFLVIHIPECWL